MSYANADEAIRALSTVNATKEGIIDFVQGLSVEASHPSTISATNSSSISFITTTSGRTRHWRAKHPTTSDNSINELPDTYNNGRGECATGRHNNP